MDGRRGGCCIARYAMSADMSKIDQIMLRFRPIVPRPATGESVAGGVSAPLSRNSTEACFQGGRGKRKCNASSKKTTRSRREEKRLATLPLIPERPDWKDSPADVSPAFRTTAFKQDISAPIWLSIGHHYGTAMRARSIVTVECITDTSLDRHGLGWTDEERMSNLEGDTCPGLISDGLGRVTWTNGAHREMVGRDEEATVCLVMKERVPANLPACTCRVRWQYTRREQQSSPSLMVLPCDVWRLDGGGFAWRLDVKAALCLGR